MWIDRGKTILLNVLVLLSLVFSWLLLSSQPNYDYLHPAQYVDRQPIGEKKDIKQLVKPQFIIFHYGNKKYTGANPDSTYYRIIEREMEKWYFFNLKKVHLSEPTLKEILNDRKAMEIVYPDEIPAEIMGELFTYRGKTDSILSPIKRILIYVDETDKETYALFCNRAGEQIQARTAMTSRDLEQFYLSIGNTLPSYTPVAIGKEGEQSLVYIPSQDEAMKEYRYFFQPIPTSQMIQTLFVDPSLIRQVTERDGTTIYTDGSKAVQLPPNTRSIEYHDPVVESLEAPSSDNYFHSVVNFVNEHGGWNGEFMLENIKKMNPDGMFSYLFRQYVGSYPLYGGERDMLGAMEVFTQHTYITGFNRSLVNIDTFFDHQDVNVLSGTELLSKLTELGIQLENVEDLFLGYQAKINENHMILTPKWVIKQNGKTPILIDVRSNDKKEDVHGLEKGQDHSNHSIPSTG